jgi:protein-L-isoaspartate(D-aspartate) O-methyltransferase
MAYPALAARARRHRMVVTQIMSRGVRDRRVLATLAWVPREWFVPPALAAEAYHDGPLPIGNGQTISQPYVVAWMTEALELKRRDRVLEIGTGSGYQSAVLARLAARVFTIERLPDLLVEAEERFRRLGMTNIATRLGDGALGWPEQAPFDGIIVTAAAPRVPPALLEQLAPGGRLVIPLGDAVDQELVVARRTASGLEERRVGGVRFVPLISRHAFLPEGP